MLPCKTTVAKNRDTSLKIMNKGYMAVLKLYFMLQLTFPFTVGGAAGNMWLFDCSSTERSLRQVNILHINLTVTLISAARLEIARKWTTISLCIKSWYKGVWDETLMDKLTFYLQCMKDHSQSSNCTEKNGQFSCSMLDLLQRSVLFGITLLLLN